MSKQSFSRIRAIVVALAITFMTNYGISLTIDNVPGNPPPRPLAENVPGNPPPKPLAENVPGNPPPRPLAENVPGNPPPRP